MPDASADLLEPPIEADRAMPQPGPNPKETSRLALLALLAAALAIGFSPIFVRLSELGPVSTAFYRVSLGLPVVLALALREQAADRRRIGRETVGTGYRWPLLLCGTGLALDLILWHLALHWTNVANATLLANLAPVFVAIGAVFTLGERLTRRFTASLAGALFGAALLVVDRLDFAKSAGRGELLGDALAAGAAVFYAIYILSLARLRTRLSGSPAMLGVGLISAAILLPIAWASGETLWPATGRGWRVLLGLALISQVAGQGLIAYALARLPASFSSLSLLLQPVFAALLAWILLGEGLGPLQLAGGTVVLVSVAAARGRRPRP